MLWLWKTEHVQSHIWAWERIMLMSTVNLHKTIPCCMSTVLSKPCPEKQSQQYSMHNFIKILTIFEIISQAPCPGNNVIIKYPTTPHTCLHYVVKYSWQKTSVSCVVWQFCWKTNSLESWCLAGSSCNFKQHVFITISFTNLLYQFSILFVIIILGQFSCKLEWLNKETHEMVFTEKDKALIKILYFIMGYGLPRLMWEFPGNGWNLVWIGQPHYEDILNTDRDAVCDTSSTNLYCLKSFH